MLGANSTSVIRQSLSDLSKYRAELEQIKNNGGIHPITGLTASDVVKSAGYLNAIDEAKVYAKVVKDAIKQEADEYTRRQKQGSQHLDQLNKEGLALQKNAQIQQKLTELQEKAWISQTKSGFRGGRYLTPGNAEAAQGYRDIANAYQTSANQLQSKYNEDKANFSKQLDEYAKTYKAIEDKLRAISPNMDGRGIDGKGLKGKDRSYYEGLVRDLAYMKKGAESEQMANISNLENQASKIKELIQLAERYNQLAEQVSKSTYKPYDSNSYEQKRISDTAALKNAILERYKAEQDAEKKRKKDEADAAREAKANEKQRQNELKNTEHRYDSLGNKVRQLRSEYSRGISIGADVSKAEAEIKRLISIMRHLSAIRDSLSSGYYWRSTLGELGNIGSGHDTTLASRVLQDQKAVNREVQRGVELEQKRQQEIAKSAAKARNDLAAAFAGANAEAKKMQSIVGDIKSLFLQGGIVFGAQQFFNSIVQTGGEIVQQHVALRSILGDVQKADELFAQTQQLALQSPFKFGELNRDVKQLAAFGVEANDLYDTTKRLADIASGLGVDFGRLGLAFGQVKARSWLDGKELRQFAYAGLPLLQKITELYNSEGKNGRKNYTQADVKKMISGRQVSFEDVQKVLWKMTDEGGQFYNMQLVLSETLLGRWNKLIDAWDIMLGKFAEGKNVIGGTFSFIINRVTDLVLALDKLSPAILSFGAIFAARKLGLMASGKLGLGSLNKNYTQQLNMQLRAYAIEQQQLVTEGKITQQKALQNVQARGYLLSDTASRANAMSRLALEGKMSILQLQKAFKEGLVTKELIKQLAAMGQITAKQEQIILGGTRFAAIMNMGIAKIGGGIKSLFTMLGGWVGLALGVAVQTISSYNSAMDRITENANGLRDSAYNKKKGYEDELANDKPTNSADLQQRVNTMKELLRNSGDYTQTIEDQISKAKDLNEQYDILNKGIIAARDNSQQEANDSEVVAGALGASGGWGSGNPFTDTLEESVEDLNEAVIKYQTLLSGLDEDTKARMDSIANQFLKPEERTLALDEKIRILSQRGGENWDSFVLKSSNGSNDIANSIYKIGIRADKVTDKLDDISKNNVPRIIKYLQKAFNAFGIDFSKWCNNNSARFESMVEKMLDACKVNVPQIREYLKSIFYQEAGAKQPKKAGGGKTEKPKTPMQQRVRRNLSKKGKSRAKVEAQATMLDSYLDETSDYNTDNNLQTELQNRYNEYKNRENKFKRGKISKALRDEAWESYNSLNQAAWEGLGYKFYPQDKKSNNVPKGKNGRSGRKEDTELKRLQERLSSLKSARQMYQKYKSIMPDEEAKKKTYNLFPEVTGLNLDDYQKAVHSLLEGFRINTTERKKFQTSIYREVAEWLFDEKDKKEYERKAADFNESMNKLSERWDLYKSLLEKTGSKFFAESAWVDAFQMDDKTKSLMDEYYAHYHEIFNLQDSLNMTDGEAKEKLKLPNQYEEWKKITELLRGNYVNSLQDGAEAISQTMSVAQKLDAITDKYDKKRKNAGDNKELVERYDYLERQEKSGIIFDQLKNEINWDGIFGSLDNYTKKELRKIRKQIRELVAGGILDGMSTTDLKSFYDGMEKLNQAIDGQGFSGLSDLIREMVDASTKYDEAVKEYNAAVSKYGKDDWRTEAASKKMHEAENRKRNTSGSVTTKKNTILGNIETLAGMFKTLGMSNGSGSALLGNAGDWTSAIMKMSGSSDKNSSKVGGIVGMFAGLTEAIGEKGFGGFLSDAFEDIGNAVNSIFKDIFGLNLGISGADYSDYNKAKAEYDNLINVWDTLISKKKQYLSEHWGTEAQNASKEALALLNSEIEQTKIIARDRLNSGASAGSHSIWYRMWKGSYDYNGTNWRDVAGNISSKYGVQFNGMEDMLNMSPKVLENIKTEYSGLWAHMDGDFRDYLDKLIEYSDQVDDMTESITEKLTGNKFSDLVSSWGDAMSAMANSSDNLVEHFEDNLKKTILNSMIENTYGDKIKALLKKTQGYAENGDKIKDSNGNVISEYTGTEYADVKNSTEELSKQIEATRDYLKKTYGWSDNSSSSSRNSVKSITEETGDLIASYLNAIRLDCSVMRAEQAKYYPEMSEIAKSQLSQLNAIARNTLRNADAAERIESIFTEYNDNFNRVLNGTKSLKMK